MSKWKHCTVRECKRPVLAKGLCRAHYERMRRGDVKAGVPVKEKK